MSRKLKLNKNGLKSLGVTIASAVAVLAVASVLLFYMTLNTNASSGTSNVQANVVVSTYCQLTISNTAINFGVISPGTGVATANLVLVSSIGNSNANVQVEGTTWTYLANSFPVGNTVWNGVASGGIGIGTALTTTYANTVILPAVSGVVPTNILFFGISAIPSNQLSGVYSQTITLQAYCSSSSQSSSVTVTATVNVPYECFIGVANTVISFGSLNPGSNTPYTSNGIVVSNPGGSTSANILVAGGNWINGGTTFYVANTVWASSNVVYTSGTPLALYPPLSNLVDTKIQMGPNANAPIYFGVAVPQAQAALTYTQNIIVQNEC